MTEAEKLLLRAEDAIGELLSNKPPNEKRITELLDDIARWLQLRSAERN